MANNLVQSIYDKNSQTEQIAKEFLHGVLATLLYPL